MGREAVLVVSFGTAVETARVEEIGGVERALEQAMPGVPQVRAYTSPTIRKILARRGVEVPSLGQALEEQVQSGVERLYVLPTHLLPGYEYDRVAEEVESFRARIPDLRLAPPLMGDARSVCALAQVLMERWPIQEGRTIVLAGHGSDHSSHLIYPALQGILNLAGRSDFLVGTIEGWPGVEDLLPSLRRQGCRKVTLAPLMLVAGTHVREDLDGDGPDSWRACLEREGLSVELVCEGLGRLPGVRQMYVQALTELSTR